MEHIWSSEIDSILSVGRTLNSVGVRNWALDKDVALAALEQLRTMQVAVLGGDVYTVSGASLESNYDNWYCNRNSGEADVDFVERSISKARSYITSYQANLGNVFFAIVPSVVSR